MVGITTILMILTRVSQGHKPKERRRRRGSGKNIIRNFSKESLPKEVSAREMTARKTTGKEISGREISTRL